MIQLIFISTMLYYVFTTMFLQIGELVEGIFQAGFWAAIVLVVVVAAAGYWLVKKFRK